MNLTSEKSLHSIESAQQVDYSYQSSKEQTQSSQLQNGQFQILAAPQNETHTQSGIKKHQNLNQLCNFTARSAVKMSD